MKRLLLALIITGANAVAELDPSAQEGLNKTQHLLRSKSQRQDYFQKNPQAEAADKKVDALSGNPKVKEEIYGAASDIFADIVKETSGDPVKQQQLLDEAFKNPEAFLKRLTPEQRARIKGIANQIENESPPASKPK